MNKDILKKAVELADGWKIRDTEYGPLFGIGDSVAGLWGHMDNDPFKPPLDALAAQLVRQVDALDVVMYLKPRHTEVCKRIGVRGGAQPIGSSQGPDRTENTITAIVESNVLSTGEVK